MIEFIDEEKVDFRLTKREIMHIVIAWVAVSFAFSFRYIITNLYFAIPMILLGTLTGFIIHELAHKFVANRYGAYAEFHMWETGLVFAIALSLITLGKFTFAAPGAVYVGGKHLSIKQNGIVSIAGPIANLIIAMIMLFLGLIITSPYISLVLLQAGYINGFLGLFNMIPIPPLDGYKVFLWNKGIWIATSAILFVITFVVM